MISTYFLAHVFELCGVNCEEKVLNNKGGPFRYIEGQHEESKHWNH